MTEDTPAPAEPETPIEAADAPAPEAAQAPAAEEAAVSEEAATEAPSLEEMAAIVGNVTALNPMWAVGRRKSSSARVRLFPGGGNVVINGRPHEEYFCLPRDRKNSLAPLSVLGIEKEYDVRVNVHGGGTTGQAGAVSLGIARALVKLRPSLDPKLRESSLLTRDARVAERKKYGRRGARRGFQFSKR